MAAVGVIPVVLMADMLVSGDIMAGAGIIGGIAGLAGTFFGMGGDKRDFTISSRSENRIPQATFPHAIFLLNTSANGVAWHNGLHVLASREEGDHRAVFRHEEWTTEGHGNANGEGRVGVLTGWPSTSDNGIHEGGFSIPVATNSPFDKREALTGHWIAVDEKKASPVKVAAHRVLVKLLSAGKLEVETLKEVIDVVDAAHDAAVTFWNGTAHGNVTETGEVMALTVEKLQLEALLSALEAGLAAKDAVESFWNGHGHHGNKTAHGKGNGTVKATKELSPPALPKSPVDDDGKLTIEKVAAMRALIFGDSVTHSIQETTGVDEKEKDVGLVDAAIGEDSLIVAGMRKEALEDAMDLLSFGHGPVVHHGGYKGPVVHDEDGM